MSAWFGRPTLDVVNGLNLRTLKIDEAYVNFTTSATAQNYYVYTLSEDCDKCPYKREVEIKDQEKAFVVSTFRRLQFKVFDHNLGPYEFNNNTPICHLQPTIGQFGVYHLNVEDGACTFTEQSQPVNIYLAMLSVFMLLAGFLVMTKLAIVAYTKFKSQDTGQPQEEQAPADVKTETPVKKRLKSLDTFRGFAIVLMIFVNAGGGHYWWIEHATWNGLHVADLVFPFFLWIMGVCIPISVKAQMNRGVSKFEMLKGVLRRSIQLFLIGVILNSTWGSPLEQLRIFGVLQRFGVAYLVVSTVYILFWRAGSILPQDPIKRTCYDILLIAPQWGVILLLTLGYLLIIYYLPVPNCSSGYFGPGGIHEMRQHPHCIGGAVGFVDRQILGLKHLYQRPAAKRVFDSEAFDPEGVLGCLPTILHAFIGLQAGVTLVVFTCYKARVLRWSLWAVVLGLSGGLLCGFSQNDGVIPVNKNLWSLSFVLVTCSLAFVGLTICYLLIDVKNWWQGAPFIYPGMNAIIMYVGHSFLHSTLPWRWSVENMNTHFLILFENVWTTTLWIFIAYYLYRRKFFYSL